MRSLIYSSMLKKGFDYVVEEVSDDLGWKSIRNLIADECGVSSIPHIRVRELNKKI